MIKVFDADILIPKDRSVVVGGKEFKINFIPMAISIKIYSIMGNPKSDIAPVDSILSMVEVITDVLQVSDKTVTKEWVMNNVDIRQLNPMFFEICNIMASLGEPEKKEVVKVMEASAT